MPLEHFTDDVALMIEEAKAAKADGIACLVDGGHGDMVRSLDALKRITTESGLPIVASGGYYMQRTYPADLAASPPIRLRMSWRRKRRHRASARLAKLGSRAVC